MNTVSQIFPRTSRISGREVGDGTKLDVPATDRQNEKKQEIFKKFQATTCNESLQSPSPSLTGFNIQASMMKIVTSERWASPELVSRKLEMAPNRMSQQLTDKTKKKQEIFKNFQATTVTNRFNPPLPPSLDSTYKHP